MGTALVLGLLSAIGPFAIDMYLPALPSIGQSLGASVSAVQASLMAFFISLGIGQGYNTFTMLQLAHAMATLTSGGIKYKPHLTLATENVVTRERTPLAQEPPVNLGFKPENIDVVLRAMHGVTTEGTGAGVFAGAGYASGGKTGTAQAVTIGQKDRYDARKLEEHQRDHSLYLAFAPVDKPTVALAVVVENAGFGATSAAPIARRVLDYWLQGLYPNEEDLAAVSKGQAAAPIGKPLLASEVLWPMAPRAPAPAPKLTGLSR